MAQSINCIASFVSVNTERQKTLLKLKVGVYTGQHDSSINTQIVYTATTQNNCMRIVATK